MVAEQIGLHATLATRRTGQQVVRHLYCEQEEAQQWQRTCQELAAAEEPPATPELGQRRAGGQLLCPL